LIGIENTQRKCEKPGFLKKPGFFSYKPY